MRWRHLVRSTINLPCKARQGFADMNALTSRLFRRKREIGCPRRETKATRTVTCSSVAVPCEKTNRLVGRQLRRRTSDDWRMFGYNSRPKHLAKTEFAAVWNYACPLRRSILVPHLTQITPDAVADPQAPDLGIWLGTASAWASGS